MRGIFWGVVLWMIVWGAIGALLIRRRYLHRNLDTTDTRLVGAMTGAALGPVGPGAALGRDAAADRPS